MIRLLRFFGVSRLHPRHSATLVAACVAFGIWTIRYDPGELDSSLGLLLVLQLFLASTGFTARAFAGHFDMVMVAGAPRRKAALAHWLVSIAPGVIAWVAMALAGLAVGSGAAVSAFAGRRATAMVIVSSVAWAAGYRLPRGAAGVLWLAVLVSILLQHNLRALSMSLGQGRGWAWESTIVLVCPFLLIGDKPLVPALPLLTAAGVSVAALLTAVRATTDLNVVLRERG